jgi:hypothetical protein
MREGILKEIAAEREYQEGKWGNTADDILNLPNDYVSYISAYSTRWFPGGYLPYSPETVDAFRKSMIKTAALAVAAVESLDRQRSDGGTTFYEGGPRGDKLDITSPRGGNNA